MNSAHIHLVVNHAPLFGLLFGVFLLGFGWLKRSRPALLWATGILLGTAIVTGVAMQSGEGAEELVKNFPGVTHEAIEKHESAAKTAALLIWLTAGLAFFGQLLDQMRRSGARIVALLAIGLGVVAIGAVIAASNLGGHVRHSEIEATH